jgi:hypothetical protein
MSTPSIADPPFTAPLPAHEDGDKNEIRDACGCTTGARFMTVGLLAALAWIWVRHGVLAPAFVARLPLVLAVALVGAVVGKVIGIITASGRDRRDTERLVRAIRRAEKGEAM